MAIQLQAKNRDGGRNKQYATNIDSITLADINWLAKFAQDNLNLNPSLSVVLRAALSHYGSFLMSKGATIRGLDEMAAFLQEHRDLMFTVSGRPENASDARYETK